VLRSQRRAVWLAFGAFCGLGVAMRSTVLVLALAAMILTFLGNRFDDRYKDSPPKERGVRAALFAAGLVLALLPWSMRNFEAYGSLSPLPHNGGIVLHQAYNAQNPDSSIWIPDFVNYLNPSEIWRGFALEAERRAGHALTPTEIDRYWKLQAEDFMRQHPGAVLQDISRKILKFFASTEIPINRSLQEEGLFSPLIGFLPGPAPWLLGMGLAGLIWLAVQDRRWPLIAAPLVLALLTSALFWAEDRFRFHALAVLALCSGIWVDELVRRVRSGSLRPALMFGAGALAVCGTSLALGLTVKTPPLHWDQVIWGYIKMGRPLEAQKTAERVLREQPDNAPILEALGYLAILHRDYAAAAAAYEHAVRIRPRADQAHFNLAKIYIELNEREQALQQAKIAASLKPDPEYQKLVTDLQSVQ
jgi:4-amino-4-deoxy-L-arabinose transferase-like glycosyltransferase